MKSILTALVLLLVGQNALAKESTLTISVDKKEKIFSRTQLLAMPGKRTLKIDYDPAYPGMTMNYVAVPAAEVFKDIPLSEESTILFKCSDGFSAPLSKNRMLATGANESKAYIAIEDPHKPWPKLKDGRSIGPFYLVWLEPMKSAIGQEEWPFMLSGFEVKSSVEETFPLTVPAGADETVSRGYKLFQKNCFACHTLNGQGASSFGPDLNSPMSVTEYFSAEALRSFIRDPQTVRKWPQAKMKGFSKEMLSETDLDSLLEYLTHMADTRPPAK